MVANAQRTEIVASRVQFLGPPPAEKTEASAVEEPLAPAEDVLFSMKPSKGHLLSSRQVSLPNVDELLS